MDLDGIGWFWSAMSRSKRLLASRSAGRARVEYGATGPGPPGGVWQGGAGVLADLRHELAAVQVREIDEKPMKNHETT